MTVSGINIDVASLAEAFSRRRQSLGLSLDDVEDRIGISKSTLSRIERGIGKPDAATLATIAAWLDRSLACFLEVQKEVITVSSDTPLLTRIAAVLESDSTLSPEARKGLLDLMEVALKEVGYEA